jgi:hypothetical protein
MPDEPNKPVTITYPSGKIASQVVDILVRKRPAGWGRKSYATYYREDYAKGLIKELDSMIETRRNKVFRCESMPHLTLNTIYLWINQSFRYVRDYLDQDGKYDRLWREIRVERVPRTGVILKFRDFVNDTLHGEDFVAREDRCKWKKQVDDYLTDDDKTDPLHIEHLLLTPEEIDQVKSELSDLGNVQFSVTSKEIKIVKTS